MAIDGGILSLIRDKLMAKLPTLFNKEATGMFYKIMSAVALELADTRGVLDDLGTQVNITSASGEALDRHGKDYQVSRIGGESDEFFRQKILATYSKGRLTKQALSGLLTFIGLSNFSIEEHGYNQWFLSTKGDIFENTVEEEIQSTTSTTITTHFKILPNTAPSIWLKTDTGRINNYGLYVTVINNNEIELSEPLPSENAEIVIRYVPYTDNLPRMRKSFMHRDTVARITPYLYTSKVISKDQDGIVVKDVEHLINPPVKFKGNQTLAARYNKDKTVLDFAYLDREENILYEWSDVLDENGEVRLNENTRIGNEVKGERAVSSDIYTVNTDFPIAKVSGVYLKNDTTKLENYAGEGIFNYKTITLSKPLLYNNTDVVIDYLKYPIINYEDTVRIPLVNVGGYDDTKYTVELLISPNFVKYGSFKYNTGIKYGQFKEIGVNQLAELLNQIKAAGVRIKVAIVRFGAVYGISNYGQDYYGNSPYWKLY